MNRAMKRQMVRWRPILSARIPAKKTPTPVPAKKTKEAILDMILLPHTRQPARRGQHGPRHKLS